MTDKTADLRELEENDLCKINVFGAGTEACFIVHRLVPLKIEKDLGTEQKPVTTFLDHVDGEPGKCLLFARTALIVKQLLTDDEYRKEKEIEIRNLKNFAK